MLPGPDIPEDRRVVSVCGWKLKVKGRTYVAELR